MGLNVCYSQEQGTCQCTRFHAATDVRWAAGAITRRERKLAATEAEYNFGMSQVNANAPAWSGKIILNVRKRRVAFHHYKCITGMWPLLTAVLYAGRFLLMFGLIVFLLWYGRQHSASANRVTLYSLIGFVPLIFVWNVLETLAWNFELRRKGMIGQGIYLGLTQIPAG